MEWLNNYSGLFALLAVIIPFLLYWKSKKDQREDMQDELDAMNENSMFPMTGEERERYTRKSYLEKKLRRK